MATNISISEFSIKVTASTAGAMKNFAKLETQLNKFVSQSGAAFKAWSPGMAKASAGVSKLGVGLVAVNSKVKQITANTSTMGDGFRSLAIGGTVLFGLHRLTQAFQESTAAAMAYERAVMAIGASIAGSDWGQRQVVGMNSQDAAAELSRLGTQEKNFAEQLALKNGMGLASTTSDYAKFFAAASGNLGVEGSRAMFDSFAKLSVVYGLDPEKQKRAMVAFTQMASKNQVMAEELKQQLGDVLPGSMDIFARAITKMGTHGLVTTKELFKLMEGGKIIATDVFPFVAKEFEALANANGAYARALMSTPMLLSRLTTAYEMFSKGVYNQYRGRLGDMYHQMLKVVQNPALQEAMGTVTGNLLHNFSFLLSGVNSVTKGFSEWFNKLEDKQGFLRGITDMIVIMGVVMAGFAVFAIASFIGLPTIFGAALVTMGAALIGFKDKISESRMFDPLFDILQPVLARIEADWISLKAMFVDKEWMEKIDATETQEIVSLWTKLKAIAEWFIDHPIKAILSFDYEGQLNDKELLSGVTRNFGGFLDGPKEGWAQFVAAGAQSGAYMAQGARGGTRDTQAEVDMKSVLSQRMGPNSLPSSPVNTTNQSVIYQDTYEFNVANTQEANELFGQVQEQRFSPIVSSATGG